MAASIQWRKQEKSWGQATVETVDSTQLIFMTVELWNIVFCGDWIIAGQTVIVKKQNPLIDGQTQTVGRNRSLLQFSQCKGKWTV